MAAAWRAVCLCARASNCESVHMYVCLCVFHRFKRGWEGGWKGGVGEIYLREQRRIGNQEVREMCREKKGRKRENYCKVRMEHIKKKVRSVIREMREQCRMESLKCKILTILHASSTIIVTL